MKHILPLLALALVSCESLTLEQRENLNQTGSLLAKKAASIAGQLLLNSAMSAIEERYSANYLHSAAQGLRSESLSIVTAEDVRRVVDIWTPEEPKFTQLASNLAAAYVEAKDAGTPPAEAVEAVAAGVQEATK